MSGEPKEIELKLAVAPSHIAALRNDPRLADALRDPITETQLSVYFDSDDLSLHDQGLTLRVRHIGDRRVQTIKAAQPGSGSFERSEWEQTIEGDQPDLAGAMDTGLGPVLTDDVRNTLKPVFETRIERTAYHLNGNAADVVMALDEGQIVATNASAPVSEIELELKQGDPAELFKIARTISDIVPAKLDLKSKSERGYDLIEKRPFAAVPASEPALSAAMTSARAFTLICRSCLHHMVANEPATIKRDAEGLHQMRIAVRRLRTTISLFSDMVADDRVEAIKEELRWIGREVAPARDLDTLLDEVLKPLRKEHSDNPGLASISKKFARERLKTYKQAQAAVQSDRFRALLLDTAEWIETGPWATSDDPLRSALREMPVELHAAEELSRRRKKIRKRGARLKELNPVEMHRLRIQIKKTRYATEFFAGVFPAKKSVKRRKKFLSSLKELQDALGGFNDVMTRKGLCTDIMAEPGRLTEQQKLQRAFGAGLITGDQQAQVRRLVAQAGKAHARFDDAKPFWK